jgi:hypothetical protein
MGIMHELMSTVHFLRQKTRKKDFKLEVSQNEQGAGFFDPGQNSIPILLGGFFVLVVLTDSVLVGISLPLLHVIPGCPSLFSFSLFVLFTSDAGGAADDLAFA